MKKDFNAALGSRLGFTKQASAIMEIWHEQSNMPDAYLKAHLALGYFPIDVIVIILLNLARLYGFDSDDEQLTDEINDIIEGTKLPLFKNQFTKSKLGCPRVCSTETIKTDKQTNGFNYVVMSNRQLILGANFEGVGGSHIDLTRGCPVHAAGEVQFKKGKIGFFDNATGHYLCEGEAPKAAAKTAFKQAGFTVKGKYIEKAWEPPNEHSPEGYWRPIKK